MATYTLDAAFPSWSSSRTAGDAAKRRRLDPRRPLVALSVTAVICAGLVLVPADAAADEVSVEELVLLAGANQGNGEPFDDHPGEGNPCENTGNPCCDNSGVGNPGNQTPGNAGNCDDDEDDPPGPVGGGGGDDDDDGPPGPPGPPGPVGGGDDDPLPQSDPVSGDDPAPESDPLPQSDPLSSPADPTPLSDVPAATQPPEILGVIEDDEPDEPDDTSGAEVLGETEHARAVPDELAFTGPAGTVPLALGGSSFMVAGVAMLLAGRRRRPLEQRQAWWERIVV